MVEGGHEVLVLCAVPASGEYPFEIVKVRPRGISRSAYEASLAGKLVEAAKEQGCDITIGIRHLPEVDVLWLHGGTHLETLEATWLSRVKGREGGKMPGPRGRHKVFLGLERESLGLGGARRVVCVSRRSFENTLRLYPQAKSRTLLLPNGIDLKHFSLGKRESARKRLIRILGTHPPGAVVSFSGRNPSRKGLPMVLEALSMVRNKDRHLVVSGPKRHRKWKRYARSLGLGEEDVTFISNLDPLVAAAGSDLSVLPTWGEPCGNVLLEAMACGTPVVTTDATGASEAVSEGISGTVMKVPYTVEELAKRMDTWLDKAGSKHVDREAVRECVADRGLDEWLDGMERIIQDVSREKGLGPVTRT